MSKKNTTVEKPEEELTDFLFPELGKTFRAKTQEEAIKLAEKEQ